MERQQRGFKSFMSLVLLAFVTTVNNKKNLSNLTQECLCTATQASSCTHTLTDTHVCTRRHTHKHKTSGVRNTSESFSSSSKMSHHNQLAKAIKDTSVIPIHTLVCILPHKYTHTSKAVSPAGV